jgi:hypothetical protein
MALLDQLYISGVWTNSDVRGTNDTGDVIISAVLDGSGKELSSVYTLTVSARSGGTGTITVGASSPNNPYNGRVITGVPFDDATLVSNVIPGTKIVFDSGAVNADSATVEVGDYQGSFDASDVGAGEPSDGVQHRVYNSGANDVIDAKASLVTQSIQVGIIGKVFNYIKPFAEDAVEKVAGGGSNRVMPYALTISGVSGSGGSRVATLSVDGVALPASSIQDLTLGTLVSGTGLKSLNPAYPYKIVAGPLAGLEFALDVTCANSDKSNILIFPSRYVQIAADVSGVEGTYGITDIPLTTAGQSSGVITTLGVAYYWVRMLVPASADSDSNPYPCNIALKASESQDAGWTA